MNEDNFNRFFSKTAIGVAGGNLCFIFAEHGKLTTRMNFTQTISTSKF